MKKLLFLLFLLPALAWAQKPVKTTSQKDQGLLTLHCKIIGLGPNSDSLTLYEFAGLAMTVVQRTAIRPDSTYSFTLPRSKARFYSVGFSENGAARIILGEEPEVTLWANAQYMDKARTVNSPANRAYEAMRKRVEDLQLQSETHRIAYAQAEADKNESLQQAVAARFSSHAKTKMRYLDSLKVANPLLWRVATLSLTPDVEAEKNPKAYANQAEFLGKEFFRFANFTDRGYDNVPEVFTAFESYAKLISNLGADAAKPLADAQLAKIPPTSNAYRMALGGLVSGFKTTQSPLYPPYTQQYLATYRNQSLGEIGRVEYELKRAGAFTPGMTAPDLVGLTPDSQQVALSQFRGNYVMVDFWASWCGPCRRENPNVVAMYEKYHAKGFNILGVSLDRERGAWVKAIEADGLKWNHISDLKGWNSEHARIYGVTSIPQTVLLDKEGRIIARNLRGEELKAKLVSIYGE